MASNEATATNTLAEREAGIQGGEISKGLLGIGNEVMGVAEVFGIDKKEIGRTLLKSAITGKLEFPGMKTETGKRKKLEVAVDQAIKLAWTFFGIFMIFQVFMVVVGIVT